MNADTEAKLRDAIATALESFINQEHLHPGTKAIVTNMVASFAEDVIVMICGDPDSPPPQGILGESPLAGVMRWVCETCGKGRRRAECLHCGSTTPITDQPRA